MSLTARGEVSAEDRLAAERRLSTLDRLIPDPVLDARVMLRHEPNPSLERPARAEAELDVNGRLVCGRVAAAAMPQAIAELEEVLTRQLRDFADRRRRRQRMRLEAGDGHWRHGSWTERRPAWLVRPAGERELVRRKTFAIEPLDPLQAAAQMIELDHDFYLFQDAGTGADAVVYRRDDGRLALIEGEPSGQRGERSRPRSSGREAGAEARSGERGEPAGADDRAGAAEDVLVRQQSRQREPLSLPEAISQMDEVGHRFMFFPEAESGRGAVLYMRYDGHYGLIEPAS